VKDGNKPEFRPNPKLKLMDQVREVLRYRRYAYRTGKTDCQRILRYIRYFGRKTHPRSLGARDIEAFLPSPAQYVACRNEEQHGLKRGCRRANGLENIFSLLPSPRPAIIRRKIQTDLLEPHPGRRSS